MSNYYSLSWEDNSPVGSSAYAPDEDILGYELIPKLKGKHSLPFDLQLKKLTEGRKRLIVSDNLEGLEEVWMDYQPNSLAWPLMSQKLKAIIENNLTGNEKINWLFCNVKANGEKRPYYVLRFNKLLDVLNLKKTKFVPGTDSIIKPAFSLNKVKELNVFTKPTGDNDLWKITHDIYVSESVKKAIEKEQLSGIEFSKVLVV